ncbi:acetyl-CoA synthetase-like protein [Punctularia strigosozonata HHB-11173 SS5]|uniref:acetyl-CoA synthetase-like protein n=1 Tax=Punctularia strigosozonata (strain HHB-11173) TaxID=741275 RepID=UPI0004417B95|nr:acetyl-CoA synthetase-like protein [Punctularia strigosozonata HHB-11173 SS5]EIN05364.1 acetyl-CoA synthetase-like protein [Punctularia strigosozonata HHB-11173 SS5]
MASIALPPLDAGLSLPGLLDFHSTKNANLPFAIYSSQDAKDPHDLIRVTFFEFTRATHRVALSLGPRPNHARPVIALLIHCDTLSYTSTIIGVMRAGYIPFPLSPRNSPPAVVSMLSKTDCTRMVVTRSTLGPLIDVVVDALKQAGREIEINELPALADLFPHLGHETVDQPFNPYETSPNLAKDDIALYLHSSGSTGFPKPISLTHETLTHWWQQRPFFRERDREYPESAAGGRKRSGDVIFGSMALPSFHTLGVMMQICAPLSSGRPIAVFQPQSPPTMPNPDNTLKAAKATGTTALPTVPAFLEAWIQSESALEVLRAMDAVSFTGGPLAHDIGDRLVHQGVKLTTVYGGTEFGAPISFFPRPDMDPFEWAWIAFDPTVKPRFAPQENGLYEYGIVPARTFTSDSQTTATHRPSVENLPDVRGYATSDLFEKHPTKEGLWRIVGRTDDVIVLATGEKIVPVQIEGLVLASPLVQGAVMFGRARDQAGILLEPKPAHAIDPSDQAGLAEFRNAIWPTLVDASKDAPDFARIFKELIIVTHPDKPLPRAGKGTVQRKAALELYSAEIDALYDTVADSMQLDSIPDAWDKESITAWLIKQAEALIPSTSPDASSDLFVLGMDSLGATFLRNRVIAALRARAPQSVAGVDQGFVYTHPVVSDLASAIESVAQNHQPKDPADIAKAHVQGMTSMYERYAEKLGSTSVRDAYSQASDPVTVLVTGTTGSLGSYLLHALLNATNVARVYAVNRAVRGVGSRHRQLDSFKTRELKVDMAQLDAKVVFVDGDTSRDQLGLANDLYSEIKSSVHLVIHNAWRLDFNLTLSSFESHVKATTNLLRLAIETSARFAFTSSVAAGQSWQGPGDIPEDALAPQYAVGTGYGESKHVAESLVLRARVLGLSATVVRVGQLSGDNAVGVWSTTDWFPILVKSSISLGIFPDVDGAVSWVPMDTAARALADVAALKIDAPPVVNLAHPKRSPWHELVSAVAAAVAGGQKLVPYAEWLREVEKRASDAGEGTLRDVPAIKLLDFFRAFERAGGGSEAFGVAGMAVERAANVSPALRDLHALGKEDAERWVRWWRAQGFLPA